MGLLMVNRISADMVHFLQLSLDECVPCLGVMGTMYLEDVMNRVPRSPHSLQALLLSHTSSLDVPKLLFALLQLLLSAGVSGRPFDIPFVAPVSDWNNNIGYYCCLRISKQ